jgi:hypothetical protein
MDGDVHSQVAFSGQRILRMSMERRPWEVLWEGLDCVIGRSCRVGILENDFVGYPYFVSDALFESG